MFRSMELNSVPTPLSHYSSPFQIIFSFKLKKLFFFLTYKDWELPYGFAMLEWANKKSLLDQNGEICWNQLRGNFYNAISYLERVDSLEVLSDACHAIQ